MCKKVAFLTLGCKVNMYETQAMSELFEKAGYEVTDFGDFADVYVINTCTVTNLGNKKSRQQIRKAKRTNPLSTVVAVGCYAQVAPEEVSRIEGINIVLGTQNRASIVELTEKYNSGDEVVNAVTDISRKPGFESLTISNIKSRTRAYIKIQDGCNRYCSYCIIPYARGNIRSRDISDIVSEIKGLAAHGFKEAVLTGIHVASYGVDTGKESLTDVIERVHEIEGIERIRLSSMEPLAVTEDFLKRVSALPKVCDHFHLSLQSGSDRVLKAMNRRYTREQYIQAADALRRYFPDCALTTDIIVGFPGESEEDFEQSMSIARRIHLDKIHVFPFSPKKGTPAAKMKCQTEPKVKSDRCKRLMALSDELNEEFLNAHKGRVCNVLFETKDGGYWSGHTTNYIRVLCKSEEDLANKLVKVKLTGIAEAETMYGERK